MVKADQGDKPMIAVSVSGEDEESHPEEFPMTLLKMKETAEASGHQLNHAVVTLPAYFHDS